MQARENLELAQRNLSLARRRTEDFASMSDLRKLEELQQAYRKLGPQSWKLPRIRRWLDQARKMQARIALHRRVLARLERIGRERSLTTAEAWQREVVGSLLPRLEQFALRIPEVERWPAQARRWRRESVERQAAAWKKTIALIRLNPLYNGLQIKPQDGLVPLRRNVRSSLWEFAHLPSGELPQPDTLSGWKIRPETCIVLVLMPGGTFRMGAKRGEVGPNQDPIATDTESPVHEVELGAFFISRYQLTQAQWQRLSASGKNPSVFHPGRKDSGPIDLTHPVENVSWIDCTRLLARAGLGLPTEAQWEYAARAGTRSPWWTGIHPRTLVNAVNIADRTLGRIGWKGAVNNELDDGYQVHAPVATLRPNPYGLHHVLGNLWEWCRDPYHERAYRFPTTGVEGQRVWPAGWTTNNRVNRGGTWAMPLIYARSSFRSRNSARYRNFSVGLRPARPLR